jgi:2-polyprenyl-3-methyl-5-hydroxy-6-metoxy-1,4-benzoquinol methylase
MEDQTTPDRTNRYRSAFLYAATPFDFNDHNDSHVLAVASVPPGSRVLDVGCGDGFVAGLLKDRGCTVVGIDVDPTAIEIASHACDRAVVVDLESHLEAQLAAIFGADPDSPEQFDVVLFLDVVEHLRQPESVVSAITSTYLAPHGRAIFSIPNVGHGAVRLALLNGNFEYTEHGLLDYTHLKFFTRSSVRSLVAKAGLCPVVETTTQRAIDGTEIPVDLDQVDPGVLQAITADPDATAYQFILIATHEHAPTAAKVDLAAMMAEPSGAMLGAQKAALENELVELRLRCDEADRAASESSALLVTEQRALTEERKLTDRLRDEIITLKSHHDAAQSSVARLQAATNDARHTEERLRLIETSQTWMIGYAITQPLRITKRLLGAVRRSK